jgi:hypothetical protein
MVSLPAIQRQLPTIQDLYGDIEVRERENDVNVLLNQNPKPEWVKTHPMTKTSYLPIERVEYLLTRIFQRWRVEVLDTKLIGNSVLVTVRLHYKTIQGEWDWQDGVGASPLQTDKGAGAIEFNSLKSGAVMMAAPAAETFAIKDAAEKLGRLFGKDLNRKDEMNYDALVTTFDTPEKALQAAQKKIMEGFKHYKGEDKKTLKEMCQAKVEAKEFTFDFAQDIAKKIGVAL